MPAASAIFAAVFFMLSYEAVQAAMIQLPPTQISKKVYRASGIHALFLWAYDGNNAALVTALQGAGCDLADRVVVNPADPGADMLIQIGYPGIGYAYPKYVYAVDGCTPIDNTPGRSPTAPRVVKVEQF